MKKNDIISLLNKIYGDSIEEEEKYNISEKIILYDNYIELSPISLVNVIETFIHIEKLGYLDKIDDDLFVIIKNILCNNQEDKISESEGLYILDYLNYLIIPYDVIKCENEYDLPKFLGEFEIMVSYIEDDENLSDIKKIKEYNEELYNIIKFRISWFVKNINSKKFNNFGFQDHIIFETTLAHLMTIYYFSFDKYEENIEILETAYNIILENYDRLKEYCYKNNIYNDLLSNGLVSNNNIIGEYEFCKELLNELMENNKKKVKK